MLKGYSSLQNQKYMFFSFFFLLVLFIHLDFFGMICSFVDIDYRDFCILVNKLVIIVSKVVVVRS